MYFKFQVEVFIHYLQAILGCKQFWVQYYRIDHATMDKWKKGSKVSLHLSIVGEWLSLNQYT